MSVIYAIINIVNDNHYIGQTVDKDKRFKEHIKTLNGNYHCNKHLQRAWGVYGDDNFIFVVLEKCYPHQLTACEQKWINWLQPKYNMAPVAGSMLNYKHTEEARQNMSKAQLGKKHTEEFKKKMSERLKGNQFNKGRKQSEAELVIRRTANLGKKRSLETLAKLSAAQKGRLFSQETKLKMSEAAKRRWNTA